jgi:endo-1,4-beta-xylanase
MKALANITDNRGLKDYFANDFKIGTAISTRALKNNDEHILELVAREFNAITTENALKWEPVHPSENEWNLTVLDRYIEFAQKHNMYTQGHVLVWHSQVPKSLFTNQNGTPISKEVLQKRMDNHISFLVERYKGKIHSWDVVNESVTPEDGYRKSQWYTILGPEFMERAFQLTHEVDPACHLLYNDYGMTNPKRRDFVVNLVKAYKRKGIPIHGIGMQGHFSLESPSISEIEKSIEAFAATGLKVHFTELDVDVLPAKWENSAEVSTNIKYNKTLNPYVDGLPKAIEDKFTQRYEALFKLFLKHRDKIERVTFWGVSDDLSWKNNFPVRGRTNYPLLFDRQHKPKDAYFAIQNLQK